MWCNGDCRWDDSRNSCVPFAGTEPEVDLYELLEVGDSADEGEIKRSYRKLSVKYHPDKNPGEAQRFNAIRDAYEVLSNQEKRVLYDTGGMQAVKDGEAGKLQKGNAIEESLLLSLAEFYTGAQRKVRIRRRVICRKCRRTRDPARCQGCSSCPAREELVQVIQGHMIFQHVEKRPSSEDCKTEATELEVHVDRGASSGDRVVFKHMGPQEPGKIPGHVTVTLKHKANVAQNGGWLRNGNHLQLSLELSLRESLLGFSRTIRHLDGHTVELSTDSVSKPGQVIRIAGEGMPLRDEPSQFGDLYITVNVSYPHALTPEDREELMAVKALRREGGQSGPGHRERGQEL